jgi:hypothetical protein
VIVPAYTYVSPNGEELSTETPIQFLVKPAEVAKNLPAISEYVSLIGGAKLETRAKGDTAKVQKVDSIKVTDAENGIVTVYTKFEFGAITANKYPFALVVSGDKIEDGEFDPETEISSDYFQVAARDFADGLKKQLDSIPGHLDVLDADAYARLAHQAADPVAYDEDAKGDTIYIYYNAFEKHAIADELKVNLSQENGLVDLSQLGDADLEIIKAYPAAGSDAAFLKTVPATAAYKTYFNVEADGVTMVKSSDNGAQPAAIGQSVTVVVADKRFGKKADGSNYVSTFEVTYVAIDRSLAIEFNPVEFTSVWGEEIPFIDHAKIDKNYSVGSERVTYKYTPEDIKDNDQIAANNYTKAGLYNVLANQLKTTYTSEASALTQLALAGEGADASEQYLVEFWVKSGKAPARDTICATVIVKASADYSISPVATSNTQKVEQDGKLVFTAKFTANGIFNFGDNRVYEKYSQRWTPQPDLTYLSANFNWADVKAAAQNGKTYNYDSISVTDAFVNYLLYSNKNTYNVTYTFTINKYKPATGTAPVALDGATINFAPESTQTIGVQEDKAYLRIYDRVKTVAGDTIPYDEVQLRVEATDTNGNLIDAENNKPFDFNLQLTLPIDKVEATDVTLDNKLVNGQVIDIASKAGISAVSTACLTNDVPTTGVVFVKNGVLQDNATVNPAYYLYVKGWDPSLSYKVISAKNATGQDLAANQVSVDATTGKLTVTDVQNIKNECKVVVEVTLDYKFATVKNQFTVTIPAQE